MFLLLPVMKVMLIVLLNLFCSPTCYSQFPGSEHEQQESLFGHVACLMA